MASLDDATDLAKVPAQDAWMGSLDADRQRRLVADQGLFEPPKGVQRLAMVGVLLSLNRWTRLLANSLVAGIGEHVGARRMMVLAALGAGISTTCSCTLSLRPTRSM